MVENFLNFIKNNPRFAKVINRITTLVNNMKILEGKLMIETAKELEPHIKGKTAAGVDWDEVRKIIQKILNDLRALILLDKQLDKIMKG